MRADIPAAGLSGKQQTEYQGLGESRREPRIGVGGVVSARLRARKQGLVEVRPDLGDDLIQSLAALRGDHRPNQPRGMCEHGRHFPGVLGCSGLSHGQGPKDGREAGCVASANQPPRARRRHSWLQRGRGQNLRLGFERVPAIEPDRGEVAKRPKGQFAESRKLLGIVAREPVRIERQAGLLQLNKGAGRRPRTFEGQIRTPHSGAPEFRQHIGRNGGNLGQHRLDKGLKAGCKEQFECRAIPDCAGIGRPVSTHCCRKFHNRIDNRHGSTLEPFRH